MYSIEAVFIDKAFDLETSSLWGELSATHPKYIGTKMKVTRTESSMLYEHYGQLLQKNRLTSINADFDGGTIFYNGIYDLNFARLDIKNLVSSVKDAEKWISFFIQ